MQESETAGIVIREKTPARAGWKGREHRGEKEFFKTLKLKNDVISTLRRYGKYNNLIIVSKVDGIAIKEKYNWIKEHLMDIGIDIEFRGIPLGKSKGIIDMSDGIMIDDNAQFLM